MTRFCTTRWSLVMDARSASHAAARALDQLIQVYRPPVLAYVRRHSYDSAAAEDLTQSFFEQLLRLRTYASADPERGRFRVFLLVALKRFLSNQATAAHAAKRGGGQIALSLDEQAEQGSLPADTDSPDAAYDRAWARVVVNQAAARLESEAQAAGKGELFLALREFLLESPDSDDYAQAAERLGLRRNTLAVAIHRMRQRLRELVREELSDTVDGAEQIQAEMDDLQHALARTKVQIRKP